MSKSVTRHRARRHQHTLDRLRERYDAGATEGDVARLCDAAKEAVARGEAVAYGLTDGLYVEVRDADLGLVRLVYTRRHEALATALPAWGPCR